jgi:hypothetical protein
MLLSTRLNFHPCPRHDVMIAATAPSTDSHATTSRSGYDSRAKPSNRRKASFVTGSSCSLKQHMKSGAGRAGASEFASGSIMAPWSKG